MSTSRLFDGKDLLSSQQTNSQAGRIESTLFSLGSTSNNFPQTYTTACSELIGLLVFRSVLILLPETALIPVSKGQLTSEDLSNHVKQLQSSTINSLLHPARRIRVSLSFQLRLPPDFCRHWRLTHGFSPHGEARSHTDTWGKPAVSVRALSEGLDRFEPPRVFSEGFRVDHFKPRRVETN